MFQKDLSRGAKALLSYQSLKEQSPLQKLISRSREENLETLANAANEDKIRKLIVVYIRLQKISYCYRWIYIDLVTKRICNKALRH